MITKFASLYAGQVDMDNKGFEGTPVNDRWLPDEQLASVFDEAVTMAQMMDRKGFDVFWLAEHHFQREGYECIPNLLQLSVHLAHLTERIKFGCGFNVTPMWHPLRLAEDYATADILTKGRCIFGVGRGYHTREVETFGGPMLDQDANRDLFEEQVEIIFKAFNEQSFSHHGKHYDIPPKVPYRGYELEEITLVPRPINRPVECWQPIVSAGRRGLEFMAKHGIKGMIGGGAAVGGAASELVKTWQDLQAAQGREMEPGGDLIVGLTFYIDETPQKAIQAVKRYYEENMKMFAPLGFYPDLTDEQISDLGDPKKAPFAGLPTLEDAVEAGSWLCGPPEQIIEALMGLQERYPGLEMISVAQGAGAPPSVVVEQLQQFAEEVMPAFKAQ